MSLTPTPIPPTAVLGCDVGKDTIVTFHSGTGQSKTVRNRLADLQALTASLEEGCLVVCESTGGYEADLLQAALDADRPAHRADARKVKAFIRSFGTLGKTDSIDAKALARYGQERQARLLRWQAPDRVRDRLQTLVLTRRDLVVQRQANTNRRDAPGAAPVTTHLQVLIDCLSAQITAIEADIKALIAEDLALADDLKALRGIKSIGPATAPALLGLMPELGHLTRRQAAALAGLAPHPNQSGKADRYRPTRGGRPAVKTILFMPAITASKHHPTLAKVYQRLCKAGKKPIVAITALMRHLIVIANAVLRDARAKRAQNSQSKPAYQLS